MSGKERGLFRMIFKSFISSLKPRIGQTKLIGEDYYGTKYYETQKAGNSSRQLSARFFVPVNKTDFEQEIPAEWEAWLRRRRKDPPTPEEIEKNYQLQMLKKQNAAQLEAKYSSKKSDETQLPAAKQPYESFPVYEEYKNDGRDYKVKYPKTE
ncbi:NADH dehydrogenase [ubiquinone] 1 alpha subcomplex assembly factor 2 [Xylocopa sonorina]|uniref:NADH dehydrogenase [ubiquinone] 1 alpha subcomplex assembly factor 2 n=1 Tax=Xylocopa sonorina TaxID=1818115 RepID=UPI00403B1D51